MTLASSLPYYPRFIFNCSDDNCMSTTDLKQFEHIKETGSEYEVTRFKKGQSLDITWVDENGNIIVKTYKVSDIEIHQIKRDIDEPTYGMNKNDCTVVQGDKKKWLMEIYIFLNLVE
ncbi:hypothetical protein V8V91_17035 [Algoriphagus halophilus]|uniref:hypothetical protein n=1 Tax=Algoriphagus halophilus TaxID=226505 RepID=UPI00358F9D25